MKKFLSLVLALVMTMSLVTVGAGATEYKDLTDKGEIQYEEAVAVLNKLGIITGYTDGSFKPEGALTRGAAAKIIVSLMIGADAANALTVTVAPYKDVAVDSTFAAVISYCKTAGYINGYSDGTFRPTAPLTGYAFAKMLLGAVGYRGDVEGFTGTGWTMNVAKLSNQAGLLADFTEDFKGNDGVNRESACLLALNTLKATEVEYTANGNNLTVGEDGKINGASTNYTRSYVTSRNDKINQNISSEKSGNESNYYTLEFGEEHFSDLKLVQGGAQDDYGRPSNKWTLKNATIGTYAVAADFTYTNTADGDTTADKVKDMGIKGYDVAAGVYAQVNGKTGARIRTVDDIPALLGKGTVVTLYTSDTNADEITDVVVIQTQLMQVNAVKSSEVTLKKVESTGVAVSAVKDDDSNYAVLKDLKADDYVLVTPLTTDNGAGYSADKVAVPEAVTGKLSKITQNTAGTDVTGITLADTAYKMSALWSSENGDLGPTTSLSAAKEATAYLDAYGYVIYVKDVKASSSVIVVDDTYSALVDNKIVNYVQGWSTSGEEITLNVGTASVTDATPGTVWEYKSTTSKNAEYELFANDAAGGLVWNTTAATYVQAGETKLNKDGAGTYTTEYFDANVKFLFLSTEVDTTNGKITDVTGITVKEGVSEVGSSADKVVLTYALNKDKNKIVAVIVPNDKDAAVTANLLYVSKVEGHENIDGTNYSVFTAYIDGVKEEGLKTTKNITATGFYTYSKNEATGYYSVSRYAQTGKTTSVVENLNVVKADIVDKTYIDVDKTAGVKLMNAKNAVLVDLTGLGKGYSSLKDLCDDTAMINYTVAVAYNDGTAAGKGVASYVFVTNANNTVAVDVPTFTTNLTTGTVNYDKGDAATALIVAAAGNGAITYQWMANGVAITGATNRGYTPSTAAAGTTKYTCVATNTVAGGTPKTATSNEVTVVVSAVEALPAGITVDLETAIKVNYEGVAAPSTSDAVASILKQLTNEGYTLSANVAFDGTKYTFKTTKQVGGIAVAQPDMNFTPSTGIVEVVSFAHQTIFGIYTAATCLPADQLDSATDKLVKGTTYYLKVSADRSTISGTTGTGALTLTNEAAIRAGTASKLIYSFKPNANVGADGAVTETYFALPATVLTNGTLTTNSSVTLTTSYGVGANKFVKAGDTVNVIVTLGGANVSSGISIKLSSVAATNATVGTVTPAAGTDLFPINSTIGATANVNIVLTAVGTTNPATPIALTINVTE